MTIPLQHPIVTAAVEWSRNKGHDTHVNYTGDDFATAACADCKATMSVALHRTRTIVTGYSARGAAYRKTCNGPARMTVAAMPDETRSA